MSAESVSIPSIWASMNSWFTPSVLFVLLNVMIGTIAITSSLANQKQPAQQRQQQQQEQAASDDADRQKLVGSPSVLQRLRSINLYSSRSQEPHSFNSLAIHFKPNPDSDSVSHYVTQQSLESQSPFDFQPFHQEIPSNEETHSVFEQIRQENTVNTETQAVFEQTHEANMENTETHGVSEQIHGEGVEEDEEEEEELQNLDEMYSELPEHHVSRTKSDTKPASGEIPAKLATKMRKSASLKSAFRHFEEDDIVEALRPATVREGKAGVTQVDNEVDAKADDFINKFKQQLKLQRIDSFIRYKDAIKRGAGM